LFLFCLFFSSGLNVGTSDLSYVFNSSIEILSMHPALCVLINLWFFCLLDPIWLFYSHKVLKVLLFIYRSNQLAQFKVNQSTRARKERRNKNTYKVHTNSLSIYAWRWFTYAITLALPVNFAVRAAQFIFVSVSVGQRQCECRAYILANSLNV